VQQIMFIFHDFYTTEINTHKCMCSCICTCARTHTPWQQARALSLKDSSISQILHKDLQYHHYKIQVAQNFLKRTRWADLIFALNSWTNNCNIVNTLLKSDEAHFQVSGYVNKKNFCHWAPNNLRELHQCPLHSAEVAVCCAVSSEGIIVLCFFENVEGVQ
jgi:hypothetical protein